jgi:hypothetical protein
MRRATVLAAIVVYHLTAAAPEPLSGTWRLERQEINGEATKFGPLTMRIMQKDEQFTFALSVPVNDVYLVSMTYALRLDGTEADVRNGRDEKMGTIQMRSLGQSQYKFILKGPNRPDSAGTLTVSPDGKTLTSEAESVQAGRSVHTKQVFSRY